ncbi:helix-turn-helix domain-containing protein [Trinickia sp. YCB016]
MSTITDIIDFTSVITDLTYKTKEHRLSVIRDINGITSDIPDMKRDETPLLTPARIQEARELGEKLARLRMARRLRQADAAARAGLARSTAALIEKGDLSRTQAQILRYLDAIAPGLTLLGLLQETDPSLNALSAKEITKRVRPLTKSELDKLDF